ncbi:ewing's tumor-associated antigen 1 isoform X1 [Clupea harengus]|uniref:Ewing's tumor-associated antigen 1 isoform X1 n=1 Tax=Clupea harengus TaxID=7950 RepID=A0A6P8EQI7_CLUHA|nr:ewing's tumor-associated antigen 1 isoform X1 [Clupea harengus]
MPNRKICTDIPWEDGAESDLHKVEQRKSKINRLKRSPKPSQPPRTVDISDITQPEFKTPTRPVRTKFGRLVGKDSPYNDCENPYDIIWDPSSPSPITKGGGLNIRGRGRKKEVFTGKTDVNDLVSRIAPKNVKPVDSSETSMLQWIGVSGIPCTPELSEPRTKTKFPKQSTHDHLKQLAKQFDYQMIRNEGSPQNEGLVQPADQEGEDLENRPPCPQMNPSPHDTVRALSLDQDMDDDDELFNELFDGPTVSIENGLSQLLSGGSQIVKPAVSASQPRHAPASGNSDVRMRGHVPASTDVARATGSVDDGGFDDDWDDDGLLDDSMVMEITQNLDLFAPPKHCSTQNSVIGQQRGPSGTTAPGSVSNQYHQQGGSSRSFGLSQVQSEVYKSGQTFRPGVNTNHQVSASSVGGGFLSNGSNGLRNAPPVRSLPCTSSDLTNKSNQAVSTTSKAFNRPFPKTKTEASESPQRPPPPAGFQSKPSQPATWAKQHTTAAATAEEPPKGDVLVCDGEAGIPDDDLDIFFALDSEWDDDVDDDDLLCEACDDVDEGAPGPAKCTVPTTKQPFSNGQMLNQNQNQSRTITSSVTTARSAEPKTHNQRPAATFAQPFPPSKAVYSTSGNGTLAKSAPPATQKTVATVAGSCNTQFQRNSLQPPSTAGVGATSFRGSSHHTAANHVGGVSSNAGSWDQRNSMRSPSVAAGVEPQRYTHGKEPTSFGGSSHHTTANQLAGKGGGMGGSNQSSVRTGGGSSSSSQYTFKRLTNSSTSCSTVTTQAPAPAPYHAPAPYPAPAPARCSQAEIERKKQEALERRRRRMVSTQTQNQNLRAPC